MKKFSEAQIRQSMMDNARIIGCHKELQQIFDQTDAKLLACGNQQERVQIAIESIRLIEMLLTSTPEDLVINGVNVKMK